ncbi:MAG: lysylphosphatidylglycerol synthase transmembrane domain-containing protein [Candidatus Micrarchaeota archaeon]
MSLSSNVKKALPFTVGLAILAIVLQKAGPENILEALSKVSPQTIATALLFALFSLVLKTFRWHFLLRRLDGVRYRDSFLIFCGGVVLNEVLPVGSGELARAQFVKRIKGTSRTKVLVPLMLERSLDVFVLLLFSLLGIGLLGNRFDVFLPVVALAIAFVAVLLFVPGIAPKISLWLSFLDRGALKPAYSRLTAMSLSFDESLSAYAKSRSFLAFMFFLTLLAWASEALTYFLLSNAVGAEMPFAVVLPLSSVSWLVGAFSFLPGGIGARETAYALLVSSLGYASFATGISASLLYRGVAYAILTFFGVLSFVALTYRPAAHKPPAAEPKN